MVYETKIKEQKDIADGTTEVIFIRPESFSFVPGQYIQLEIPKMTFKDPKGNSRVFSIASDPRSKDSLSVVFRQSDSGFKKTLTSLPIGSSLNLEGPMGNFTFEPNAGTSHVFVAGGVGISPFMSMLRHSSALDAPASVKLIYANRSEKTTAYRKELKELARDTRWFIYKEIFGKITKDVLEKFYQPEVLWWIVGPPRMVAEVSYVLQQMGVTQKAIRTESFTGY